jgi:hypothetical protein
MTVEIEKSGDKPTETSPTDFLFSGSPWIPTLRHDLSTSEEERVTAQTQKDLEQPTRDFLATRLMEMNSVGSLATEAPAITPTVTETPRVENWILRLYGLLGLAELKKAFPKGVYSAFEQQLRTRHVTEVDSPKQS